MIRILVLHYSQTGQLTRAVKSLLSPLANRPDVVIVWQNLEPVEPFPFPWGFFRFFDTFPECVHLDPPPIRPVAFGPAARFDLVVLSYQVWFLSPSLPVTAFLKSEAARVLRDTPVITFIACRNMWLSAQEKMKGLLRDLGARLVDNVVLVDQGPPWATFITTPRWVLTGKKNGFWGRWPMRCLCYNPPRAHCFPGSAPSRSFPATSPARKLRTAASGCGENCCAPSASRGTRCGGWCSWSTLCFSSP